MEFCEAEQQRKIYVASLADEPIEKITPVPLDIVFDPSALLNLSASEPSLIPIIDNCFSLSSQNCFSDVHSIIAPSEPPADKALKRKRHIFLNSKGSILSEFCNEPEKEIEFQTPINPKKRCEPEKSPLSIKLGCPHCTKKILNKQAQVDHQNQNRCKFCDKIFPCETRLKLHIAKNAKCNQLSNNAQRKQLKKQKPSCRICKRKFSTMREKEVHTLEKACACGKKYECRKKFSKHVLLCEAIVKEQTYSRKAKVSCKTCKISFANRAELEKHFVSSQKCNLKNPAPCDNGAPGAEGAPISIIRDPASDSNPQNTSRKSPPGNTVEEKRPSIKITLRFEKCGFCHSKFFSRNSLEVHLKVCNCPRCGFLQPCARLLQTHVSECRFEASEGQHECPLCAKNFLSAALLGTHVRAEHSRG